jgi:type I site-specific restriction endonuclease
LQKRRERKIKKLLFLRDRKRQQENAKQKKNLSLPCRLFRLLCDALKIENVRSNKIEIEFNLNYNIIKPIESNNKINKN